MAQTIKRRVDQHKEIQNTKHGAFVVASVVVRIKVKRADAHVAVLLANHVAVAANHTSDAAAAAADGRSCKVKANSSSSSFPAQQMAVNSQGSLPFV